MKDSLLHKLENLRDRYYEIETLLTNRNIINNQNRFRSLSKEYADIKHIVQYFNEYMANNNNILSYTEMLKDKELRELAQEELNQSKIANDILEKKLQTLLLPEDAADKRNIFLEIRAGTGGEEAALFSTDLMKMYTRYAELHSWKIEILNTTESAHGYREIIIRVIGKGAYSRLKFESGTHRVQRIPETESQGRIHTSACTIAVMPEVDAISEIEINPSDLSIDTFRASGAGGQHVNKTDSAIRITHLPSGMVVECQDERSQHKNRARAMSLLQARLTNVERERQISEQAENRRLLIGSGDRSERIRTYNFPQGRVTDHRINLTLYRLDEFMQGRLDMIIDQLISEHHADQLVALATE